MPPAVAPPDGFLQRLARGGRLLRTAPDWAAFAGDGWADRVMTADIPDRFHAKQGRSIARWILTAPDGRRLVVYLKRHHQLPRWQGWLAALLPSRGWSPALAEWDRLAWATSQSIPVARAVATGEFRRPWGRMQSFLAVEELADMLPLHEAIPLARQRLSADDFLRWKRELVAELARLSRELHRRRAFHQDLYLCHFYLPEADCGRVPDGFRGRAWMIDFGRLKRPRLGSRWWQVKDLAQLLFATHGVAGITARERVRFWKLYRGGDWGGATPPRWVRAAAGWKWKRYKAHNARKAARGNRLG